MLHCVMLLVFSQSLNMHVMLKVSAHERLGYEGQRRWRRRLRREYDNGYSQAWSRWKYRYSYHPSYDSSGEWIDYDNPDYYDIPEYYDTSQYYAQYWRPRDYLGIADILSVWILDDNFSLRLFPSCRYSAC